MPLAIDLFCGLGGWSEALLAEGYDVLGFDIERHEYGEHRYPGQLVIQDVLTLHGSQFRDAALIVASPPCQFFSYTAMPWKKAKALAAAVRADPVRLDKELALFNACFRIQREASAAVGRHVPMIVENVRGAIPWVGRSRWNFGSYHLWGDVPALMPPVHRGRFNGSGGSFQTASVETHGIKAPGMNWSDRENCEMKTNGSIPHIRDGAAHTPHLTNPDEHVKLGGSWFHGYRKGQGVRNHGSRSMARKAASAMIAKIPEPLARHIAVTFKVSIDG